MKRILPWILLFAAGLALGALLFGGGSPDSPQTTGAPGSDAPEVWTCSMHPQIQAQEPGKCPICFMDLIPVEDGGGDPGETRLEMSPEAMRLAEIRTAPVTRRTVDSELRTVGKVIVDERRVRRLTAWVGGRLDRLYVDYTGIRVSEGDHMVEIYSPELYSAQVELVESVKAAEELQSSSVAFMRENAEDTVDAVREKLRLLGLRPEQLQAIEARGKPSDHVTLYAPMAGIVIHKTAVEGEYVKTGTPIYTIADLSQVWVLLDVYESDLVWIHLGQEVAFTVEAFPGETFNGTIAFIDPVVNPETRTVKVRVNVANEDMRLKPDMFVRAVIESPLAGDGRTMNPDLAGKYICPMHLEVVSEGPGDCTICGMDLVPAEELGFTAPDENSEPPLTIPATAPLITGKRAVVYVRVPGTQKPTFEGREVVLGPRAGDHYIVESGLAEGEEVVVHGSFKIDSAMQIQAKPSMMNPKDPEAGQDPAQQPYRSLAGRGAALHEPLTPVFAAYFALHEALASDDSEAAGDAVTRLIESLPPLSRAPVSASAAPDLESAVADLRRITREVSDQDDLEAMRLGFDALSEVLIALDRSVGPPPGESHRLMFCPMAFNNRGAYWLQTGETLSNPYYGASMLRCGSLKETFPATEESDR